MIETAFGFVFFAGALVGVLLSIILPDSWGSERFQKAASQPEKRPVQPIFVCSHPGSLGDEAYSQVALILRKQLGADCKIVVLEEGGKLDRIQ